MVKREIDIEMAMSAEAVLEIILEVVEKRKATFIKSTIDIRHPEDQHRVTEMVIDYKLMKLSSDWYGESQECQSNPSLLSRLEL